MGTCEQLPLGVLPGVLTWAAISWNSTPILAGKMSRENNNERLKEMAGIKGIGFSIEIGKSVVAVSVSGADEGAVKDAVLEALEDLKADFVTEDGS